MTTALPVEQSKRATIVDIVRGFALTGVLIANFTSYSEQNLPVEVFDSISSRFDKTLTNINAIFFEWKFMTLFSILFGYGFGLILKSLEEKEINPSIFFTRRMAWLFVFGIIHTVFWWGDVLHLYAMSGIFLLLFRKASRQIILVCSLVFMFIIPPLIRLLFQRVPSYSPDDNQRLLYEQYSNGDVIDVFRANLDFYYRAFIITGADLRDLAETLGRFLFGYFLLRISVFQNIEAKKSIFKKVLFITTPVVVAYFLIRWLQINESIITGGFAWRLFIKIGILSTSCFYVSILVLCFITMGKNRFFSALQALGKMTLTNYLLISLFLVILLYGIGLRRLGSLPMHLIWICAFLWLLIEILFSVFWLRRFNYGPLEWIWRQLTYKKRIRLAKQV